MPTSPSLLLLLWSAPLEVPCSIWGTELAPSTGLLQGPPVAGDGVKSTSSCPFGTVRSGSSSTISCGSITSQLLPLPAPQLPLL